MHDSQAERLRVLFVRGKGDAFDACAAALAEEGIECVVCAAGADAPRSAAEAEADAILLDGSLSDTDASEVCRALKSRRETRYIPIVMMTFRRSDGSLAALDDRADDCLAMPFHLLELRRRMRTAAELGRTLKEVRAVREELLFVSAASMPVSETAVMEEATAYKRMSLVGHTMAGCRLLAQLGGGSPAKPGLVYLGQHMLLDVKVCVKLLPAALADWSPDELDRFVRGARAAARIDHPNVVPVLNAGREGDFYFVVRRFVEGDPLDRLLRGGRTVPEGDALNVVRQVGQGLAAAHAANVLHRDVKPANIIVTADPRGALTEAKLIDFGLARSMGVSDISSTGEIVGTPYYMSPEQCDGDLLDARSDVYSLGATLYHMVTGALPFSVPPDAGIIELLRKQINEDPPAPRDMNPRLSDLTSRMIGRMMAKNREDRYPSVGALLSELPPG